MNAAEAAAGCCISTRQFDRLVKRGRLPRPIPGLGRQTRRWRLGDIRRAMSEPQPA